MDKKPHRSTCLRYICTCELRDNLEGLKDLHDEMKEEIENLEDVVDRGCEE